MYQSTHGASHRSGSGRQRPKKFLNAQREQLIGRTDKAITIYEEMYQPTVRMLQLPMVQRFITAK